MKQNIIHIGFDVDDTQYHGCALNKSTGEVLNFKCRPTLKGLMSQLDKLHKVFPGGTLRIGYEASYVGFTLQRDIADKGVHCDVVAPTSIPNPRGKQIKTDRIDAAQLAQFYANDLLTFVAVPDPEQEQDRDLIRSRQKLLEQQTELRTHVQALLRRNGRYFKAETRYKTHWTKPHYLWLERTVERASGSFKVNLGLLIHQLKSVAHILAEYGQQIEVMANTPRYEQSVQALTCYKGIKNLFALTMITEIGNVKRFPHPRQLVSWIGMDIREYSSGGKHNRFGITKQGHRYLRTAFVEANQRGYRTARISGDLKARRKDTSPELIHIADRCLSQLNKKGNRLLIAGKHPNKVKVACAREMVGFVWESLNEVAA
ncbi:MAG: IS110 family transposase [Arenicellales bacterium]